MIKALLSLSALGLAPTPVLALTNITNQTISVEKEGNDAYHVIETWNDIKLKLQVTTPTSGTHDYSNQNDISAVSINNWDSIKEATDLTLHGLFYWHTYKEGKSLNDLALTKDTSSSTSSKLKFKFHDMHDKWSGWGHQTSEIAITVTITADPNGGGKALIKIDNYARSRTAGSVHECSTTSNIDSLEIKN